MKKSCPQTALDTMFCLTPFDFFVKRGAARCLRESRCWKHRAIGHSRILNVVFPDGRYRFLEKATAQQIELLQVGHIQVSCIFSAYLNFNLSNGKHDCLLHKILCYGHLLNDDKE